MSKRLRKRIRELCGLEGLDRLERHKLASEILEDIGFKQRLCNQVPGLSFRDIDKAMRNVLAESPKMRTDKDEEELRKIAPQKFDPEIENFFPRSKNEPREYGTYTPEETRKLVEASNKPLVRESSRQPVTDYDTYSLEEVAALMAGNYDPRNFQKRRRRKKG